MEILIGLGFDPVLIFRRRQLTYRGIAYDILD